MKNRKNVLRLKIASEKEEFIRSYRIVYDVYSKMGVIPENSINMKLNVFNTLPGTKTLLIKEAEDILSTLTIIEDSELGLPCDAQFKKEIDVFRNQGLKILELGAYAANENSRKTNPLLAVELLKAAYAYADLNGIDIVLGGVNSKYKPLYKKILKTRFPLPPLKYGENGLYETNFAYTPREDFKKVYSSGSDLCNDFLRELKSKNYKNIMPYDLFLDLFTKKTNILSEIPGSCINTILRNYSNSKSAEKRILH